jgi:hypothetical protein
MTEQDVDAERDRAEQQGLDAEPGVDGPPISGKIAATASIAKPSQRSAATTHREAATPA